MRGLQKKLSGAAKYLTPPAFPMPTWEYAIIQFVHLVELADVNHQINEMGTCGWELCERREVGTGMLRATDGHFGFVFKRRTS